MSTISAKEFKFRNTKENGVLAGQTKTHEVPEFDWEEFKKSPNAELFCRRAYDSLLQKLVRDILLNKNGTTVNHLQSIESALARSFNFTKKQVEDWCDSRDWSSTTLRNPEKAISILKDKLPEFAINDGAITDETTKIRIAEIIADVADLKSDDIAEYLWVKLTQKRIADDAIELMGL